MAAITIDIDISARVTRSRVSETDTRQVLQRGIFAEMDLACRVQRSIEFAAQAQAVVLAEIAGIIRTGQVIHNRLSLRGNFTGALNATGEIHLREEPAQEHLTGVHFAHP